MKNKDDKSSEPTIDRMMRYAYEHAERVLVKGPVGTSLTPVFATFKGKDIDLVATPWSNDEQKRIAQMLVRAKLKIENCDGYSFVSEAWMLSVDKSEYPDAEEYDGIRPSQSERRIEVVCVAAVVKTETGLDKKFQTWAIERNAQGRIIELNPKPSPADVDSVSGTMLSLMDDL
jgi:hypothetical protein